MAHAIGWRTPLAALLFVLAFPPWDFRFLIWIAYVPWFFAMDRAKSTRGAFFQGLAYSFFISIGGFFWVAYVLHQFGGLPWPLAILGLVLFGTLGICQPQMLAFPFFYRLLNQRLKSGALSTTLILATVYCGIDWLLPKLFVDTAGHSQYSARWIRQIADLGGAFMLTFLVLLVNHTIYLTLRAVKSRAEPSLWPAFAAVRGQIAVSACLLAASAVYGKFRFEESQARIASAPRHVQGAMIQANIGDFEKVAAERGVRGAANTIIHRYVTMSEQALALTPKPEFLVWPETSYPSTFRNPITAEELSRDQRLEQFVRSVNTPLLFGGYDTADGKDYNAFFLLTPTPTGVGFNSDLQVYRKNILLLFGEYIPGAAQFKVLRDAFPQVGNFGRGVGPDIQRIPTASGELLVGPVICYEVLFPSFVVEATRKGSQMILNITNDSWFGPWGEPQLHLALTTFRSVENRIPIFRATNTGISALIMPDGEITNSSGIFTQEIVNARVPIIEPMPTLFKAWGDWFGPLCFAVSCIVLLAVLFGRKGLRPPAPRTGLRVVAGLGLALQSAAPSAAFAQEAVAGNAFSTVDPPAWVTARSIEKTVARIERHLEWNLRKIQIVFYDDQPRFNQGHGYKSADVTVMAFTRPSDQSVHLSPGVSPGNLDRILGHELVHVMLQQKFRKSVPKWLEEGLANHFGQKGALPKQALKLDYAWILSRASTRDIRDLAHPFRSQAGDIAKYHYQASTAVAELIQSKCDLEQLLQLSVGKSVESYLPTLCEMPDLNASFREFLRRRSGAKTLVSKP